MRLPNWFKIAWWAPLNALLTYFLFLRYPDLVVGKDSGASGGSAGGSACGTKALTASPSVVVVT
jgi:hypothetical protein